jgi:hypothetical protein
MGFILLSDCSFQIGLDSSDFSCLFQAQETKGGTKCTELGSFSRRSTKYPVLLSFSTLSIKQNRLAVAERNLMEFVKPAVSCPIVCLSACGSRAGFGERVRALQRADCPHGPACGWPARFDNRLARSPHASSSPASSCKRIAPASRSGGARLPLPQRRPLGL